MTALLVRSILEFWFGLPHEADFDDRRGLWFRATPNDDARIADHFAPAFARAVRGEFAGMDAAPEGALALVVLTDQFPRHIHRRSARAFSGDAVALAAAKSAIARGFDGRLSPARRRFFYLPLEHSESLADQERCVALMAALGDPQATLYAELHRDIVARFGRFPHRNAALGRPDTEAEKLWLADPASPRFGQ